MRSMTGFATEAGALGALRWRWEAKSVNGRGLDLRFRLPDGVEALEPRLRAAASARLSRGNVSIGLKVDSAGEAGALTVSEPALAAAVAAAGRAEALAAENGLHLAPSTAADIVAIRGVLEPASADAAFAAAETLDALEASFAATLDGLAAARGAEGARVRETFVAILDEIERLVADAAGSHAAQEPAARARLKERVAALIDAGAEIEPERLAQELALIAVKADVSEEIARLGAHVAAARDLLDADGPVGRKLDFLTQEFNREANTLCSKSASGALTQIGLDLKVAIDQMREQAQNVE